MRKTTILALTVLLAATAACSEQPGAPDETAPAAAPAAAVPVTAAADAELATDDAKAFYALGLGLSRQLASFSPTEAELEFVKQGMVDGALGRPEKVTMEAMRTQVQTLAESRAEAQAVGAKTEGAAFAEKAAQEAGATKTASGVVMEEITAGTGDSPKATDQVKVHYTGTLIDGTVFDSSVQRGQPATFPLNGVIKCWTEGVQLMKVGGKAKLVCPSDVAYGDRGRPPTIPPGATLVFEVELLEIVAAE
jgi:FKBP-type peptidyl-prolyl cis-trans isomerase